LLSELGLILLVPPSPPHFWNLNLEFGKRFIQPERLALSPIRNYKSGLYKPLSSATKIKNGFFPLKA
jgi:hypothetical protein